MLFGKAPKYYESIDTLPVFNWFKVIETGDLKNLVKNPHEVSPRRVRENELAILWHKIYSQFIDTFGIDDTYREILELRIEIDYYKNQMILDEDRSIINFVRRAERQLQSLLEESQKAKFDLTAVYVEKYMQFRIDQRTTNVKEYYGYLKAMEEEAKRAKPTPAVNG